MQYLGNLHRYTSPYGVFNNTLRVTEQRKTNGNLVDLHYPVTQQQQYKIFTPEATVLELALEYYNIINAAGNIKINTVVGSY